MRFALVWTSLFLLVGFVGCGSRGESDKSDSVAVVETAELRSMIDANAKQYDTLRDNIDQLRARFDGAVATIDEQKTVIDQLQGKIKDLENQRAETTPVEQINPAAAAAVNEAGKTAAAEREAERQRKLQWELLTRSEKEKVEQIRKALEAEGLSLRIPVDDFRFAYSGFGAPFLRKQIDELVAAGDAPKSIREFRDEFGLSAEQVARMISELGFGTIQIAPGTRKVIMRKIVEKEPLLTQHIQLIRDDWLLREFFAMHFEDSE